MRHRIAFLSALICALAACDDPASPARPAATEPASLKQGGAQTEVAATAQLLVTGLEELKGVPSAPAGRCSSPRRSPAASGASTRRPAPSRSSPAGCRPASRAWTSSAAGWSMSPSSAGPRTRWSPASRPDLGGDDIVGIYRVDGPNSFTIVADIGAWSVANPPATDFFVPTGFQYAIEPFRGGFLVTDGHHNRVLWVTRDGEITELIAFGDVVPTGLAVSGNSIYVAQAGPIPHQPEDGKVVVFGPESTTATEVAAGARLAVDVEFGRGRTLFALSQGFWDGPFEGTPALPNTGALMRVNGDGTLTTVVGGLDRPTSVEIIKNTAYVVTLAGEIWKIDNIAGPPFGMDPDNVERARAPRSPPAPRASPAIRSPCSTPDRGHATVSADL